MRYFVRMCVRRVSSDVPTDFLLRRRLKNLIDSRHDMVEWSRLIDWNYFGGNGMKRFTRQVGRALAAASEKHFERLVGEQDNLQLRGPG